MASSKGRQTSWNNHALRLFVIEKRQEKRSREAQQRERRARKLDQIHASRREEAVRLILERVGDAPAFGLVWRPDLSWARGPSIWPFARIFDEIMGPDWRVTTQHDVLESGSPGWFFERTCLAAQKAS